MEASPEIRHMTLTYSSRCGNPDCERGVLPPGSDVVVANKRIYCGAECAAAHTANGVPRKTRATTRTRKAAK